MSLITRDLIQDSSQSLGELHGHHPHRRHCHVSHQAPTTSQECLDQIQ